MCIGADRPSAVTVHDAKDAANAFIGGGKRAWVAVDGVSGVYTLDDLEHTSRAEIDIRTGRVVSYRLYHSPASRDGVKLARGDALRIALGYIGRSGVAPGYSPDLRVIAERLDETRPSYRFLHSLWSDGVELPARWWTEIDAVSGALLEYIAVDHMPVRISTVPVLSPAQASAAALSAAARDMVRPTVTDSHLSVWIAFWQGGDEGGSDPEQQALLWRVTVVGQPRPAGRVAEEGGDAPEQVKAEYQIDASTGDLRLVAQIGAAAPSAQDTPGAAPVAVGTWDDLPVWSDDHTIYFTSTRPTRPLDATYRRPPECQSIFRADTNSGVVTSIVADGLTWAPPDPAPARDGAALAFADRRSLVVLDLHSGNLCYLGARQEGGQQPSWGPANRYVMVTAARQGVRSVYRVDLDLARCAGRGYTCLTGGTVEAYRPSVAPDGRSLAYVTRAGGKEDESVWLLGLNEFGSPAGRARELISPLRRVHALSFAPNGDSLLICHSSGVESVNLETRQRHVLPLHNLRDPTVPGGGPALSVAHARLSPDGTRIVFSSPVTPPTCGRPTTSHIYLCNLDGTGLRRLMPLDDEPVKPYTYPVTGRSAFDVADEIAEVRAAAQQH